MSKQPSLKWYINLIVSILLIVVVLTDALTFIFYGTLTNWLIIRLIESGFMVGGVFYFAHWWCCDPEDSEDSDDEK